MQRLRRLLVRFIDSPGYVLKRIGREIRMEADRFIAPFVARRLTPARLAGRLGHPDINSAWAALARRPFPYVTESDVARRATDMLPEICEALIDRAGTAMRREFDLLGSGPVTLMGGRGWITDPKTGHDWPRKFCRHIDYANKGRPSDVKMPWEISRLQWLMPAGQAYLLTGDETYAALVRDLLDDWIAANPYAWTVNWSCTMEPALRILTWTWFFHVFADSPAWSCPAFRGRFLTALHLHGRFVELHIERAQINGNHYTADAAGMVVGGLFFGEDRDAQRWAAQGWSILESEIATQVHPDGVDFEASTAYHRLVAELFLLPARMRLAHGLDVARPYRQRMCAMGRFAAAYCRPDGTTPHWGDADDARALPLGVQPLGDHRYLAALIGLTFDDQWLAGQGGPDAGEVFWTTGLAAPPQADPPSAEAFSDGGVYILRGSDMHVFVDCGPVGLGGLGGHGHNDALSFEAWVHGAPLIADPGSFVYTADFEARNLFRSTARHNTPQVGDHEINRLHAPDNLWNLHDDAQCECLGFSHSLTGATFEGRHRGYERLGDPVTVTRWITADWSMGTLLVTDRLDGQGTHDVSIPYHFAPGIALMGTDDRRSFRVQLANGAALAAFDAPDGAVCTREPYEMSPSYGVCKPAQRLVCRVRAALPVEVSFHLTLAP